MPALHVPQPAFASVDGFLAYQREAVAAARQIVDEEADTAWTSLPVEGRDRFVTGIVDLLLEDGTAMLWRRAWWLRAIGGAPRAPFETATPPEKARRLLGALEAALGRAESPDEVERWWQAVIAICRGHIRDYVADRVAAAAHRLHGEGIVSADDATDLLEGRELARPLRPPKRAHGDAERRRVAAAAGQMISLHRALDGKFAPIGPVCGACTRETGGCCSLTVPLLWREADYRLLALGGARVPRPADVTPGACPFLGDEGCRLASERRPHICRSFLCDRAQAALGDRLPEVRVDLERLNEARSRLG